MPEAQPRPARPPAPSKVKILDVADQLFYAEGIHTVGIDRIIATAHVTKATFYKHYRSKDLLIVAYVRRRDESVRTFIAGERERLADPRAVLRSLVDSIGREARREHFHGCPFINAAAQFGDAEHPVRRAVAEHRAWYRSTLADLIAEAGHPRPEDAADDLLLARDGALSGGNVGDPVAADRALHRALETILAERS
jgi:AcrR family transcriptional regulator